MLAKLETIMVLFIENFVASNPLTNASSRPLKSGGWDIKTTRRLVLLPLMRRWAARKYLGGNLRGKYECG